MRLLTLLSLVITPMFNFCEEKTGRSSDRCCCFNCFPALVALVKEIKSQGLKKKIKKLLFYSLTSPVSITSVALYFFFLSPCEAHTALFRSHTSFITLRSQRNKRLLVLRFKRGDFSIASAGMARNKKKKKKKRCGPHVSMVTLVLLLFVLGSACNKSAGREMTGQGV